MGWIGVDLDGTLAHYEPGQFPEIGEPIPRMLDRVLKWVDDGEEVRILTARAANGSSDVLRVIVWLRQYGLGHLEVTCIKDPEMEVLWDDKAIQVKPNTGEPIVDQELQEGMAKSLDKEYHEKKKRDKLKPKWWSKSDPNSFELMSTIHEDAHAKVYGIDIHQEPMYPIKKLESESD
jgi:hypothetical protein